MVQIRLWGAGSRVILWVADMVVMGGNPLGDTRRIGGEQWQGNTSPFGEIDGRRVPHPDWYYSSMRGGYHTYESDEMLSIPEGDIVRDDLQEAIERTFAGGAYWSYTGETIETDDEE